MKYTFKTNINKNEYDTFVSNHKMCNLLQSYDWAFIKNTWEHIHTGVYNENNQLCGAALVLIKHLPLSFTMFYIPRGPVLDFENKELVSFYFNELKKIAKKKHCLFIKFDPSFMVRKYNIKDDVPKMDETALVCQKNLEAIGAKFHGYSTYIAETAQPRFHMGVNKIDNLDAYIPRSTLRSKNNAIRKHVNVYISNIDELDQFQEVMTLTEERKNVHLRDYDYFKLLMDTYKDNAYLFLAKVDANIRKNELENSIKINQDKLDSGELGNKATRKCTQEIEHDQKELDSILPICEKYRKETVIAGGLMVGYGKEVEMLYAGMNDDFNSFRPQYLTYLTQFEYAFNHGYSYVSMGGVEGTLHDGLANYKSNFNPTICEYIGEFDYPVNKLLFNLSLKAYDYMKKK